MLEVMRLTAETSKILSETVRFQAETARAGAAATANAPAAPNTSEYTEQPGNSATGRSPPGIKVSPLTTEARRGVAEGPFVLSARCGSITAKLWEGMSDDELAALDVVLHQVVTKVCISDISWAGIGQVIAEYLSKFGFQFESAESYKSYRVQGWRSAKDTRLSDLARVDAASSACVTVLGEFWHTDEMFRVLHRLLQLRGFPA